MMFLILFLSLRLTYDCSVAAHNILVFLPNPIRSHYVQVEPIFLSLAHRGHNVTVVSPFPPKEEISNLRHISLKADRAEELIPPPNWMEWTLTNRLFNLNFWKIRADLNIPQVLESSVYRDLTRNDNKFDLIFTELFFGFEPLAVLGHIFQAPVVTYASYGYNPDILRYIGAANGVAYLPHFELDYAGPMSLLQRLENALIQFSVMLYNEYWYYRGMTLCLLSIFQGLFRALRICYGIRRCFSSLPTPH
ncbi:unnamed protein product [Bemisia tabaci]|uniref:UDP-glucuronosyltransferase n=2 Tax=Bemisia tabaci TaxID=7038 RepID=A0A9P0EY03_BEMTA|nr:unnamed protein product [Bemisia tabaci]